MKRRKQGFTMIEVVLFLAVTTALFVGIAAGVGNSVFQQRYNDAVQNFAEFMRSVYSQVANVQNENTGRTGKAIYGKVVVFSQEDNNQVGSMNLVKTYNLVGNIESTINGNASCNGVLGRLACLDASVVYDAGSSASPRYRTVGFVEEYRPHWDARIQTTDLWNGKYDNYAGIILVTHSPSSGNIYTYVLSAKDNQTVYENILNGIEACESNSPTCDTVWKGNPFNEPNSPQSPPVSYLSSEFEVQDIDLCINPNGPQASGIRRNIRIQEGARNASAIEVMTEDAEHNRCVNGTAHDEVANGNGYGIMEVYAKNWR